MCMYFTYGTGYTWSHGAPGRTQKGGRTCTVLEYLQFRVTQVASRKNYGQKYLATYMRVLFILFPIGLFRFILFSYFHVYQEQIGRQFSLTCHS